MQSQTQKTLKNLAQSAAVNLQDFPYILATGGDDRLVLNPVTGVNKYYCKPDYMPEVLFRGSCTCNLPTDTAYKQANKLYEEFKSESKTLPDVMEALRDQIASVYQLPQGSGVFLMPSGSDAEYIPLLIAQELNKGKKVANIVTCNEEVGSGTVAASGGRFFSDVEPIPGFTTGTVKNDDPLQGLAEMVDGVIGINARDNEGAVKSDIKDEISSILDERCRQKNVVPILHWVVGSKTGIIDDISEHNIQEVHDLGGLLVLDECQGRMDQEMVMDVFQKYNPCILITGSKFYRSPPFAGAVLVPPVIMKQLEELPETSMPMGLNTFMGKSEVPPSLPLWRDSLAQESTNYGLALRWSMSLAEMAPTLAIPAQQRNELTKAWREKVIDLLQAMPQLDYYQAIHTDVSKISDSIVSFRIRRVDDPEKFYNKAELQKVFKAMTEDRSEFFPMEKEIAKRKCFIGQPVKINNEQGVLRIALGSDSLRQLREDFDGTLQVDAQIVEKLAFLSQNYENLTQSAKI